MDDVELKFGNASFEILGTCAEIVSAKRFNSADCKNVTVAISSKCAFPENDPFLTRLTRKDWECYLAAAFARRTGRAPNVCDPREKQWACYSYVVQNVEHAAAALTHRWRRALRP